MTGAIIQARTSSTRLPGKVLKELPLASGITALAHVIRRAKRAKRLERIIIATTHDPNDQAIVDIAEQEGVLWFKGSLNNVLERYYLAAKEHAIDRIVRITSDCPCIDPEVVDQVIDRHLKEKADYTCNAVERTYPHGLDAEVFTYKTLERAYKEAQSDYQKEHVTPYITDNPGMFKVVNVRAPNDLAAPHIRITLDTQEDYVLLCAVFDSLYGKNAEFSAEDIVRLYDEKPWLGLINQNAAAKYGKASAGSQLKPVNR